MTENERFRLVLLKTGSINSATGLEEKKILLILQNINYFTIYFLQKVNFSSLLKKCDFCFGDKKLDPP
jgi:hypothetical protein